VDRQEWKKEEERGGQKEKPKKGEEGVALKRSMPLFLCALFFLSI
jgi:hypothetical protein